MAQLVCDACCRVTPHRFETRRAGTMGRPLFDARHRLKRPVAVVASDRPTVEEVRYACDVCGHSRRYGFEAVAAQKGEFA